MALSTRARGIGAAILTVGIWTGFIIVGRASAAQTLRPFDLALLRIVGAAAVALPWAVWLARRSPAARREASLAGLSPLPRRETVAIGLSGGLVYSALCYAGFFFAPAAHASVLLPGSQPLWAALLALPLLHEALTRVRLLSLACILLGVAIVGSTSLHAASAGGSAWKGDLIFLSAAVCWALYGVLARRWRLDPVRATVAMSVFAALAYVPLFLGLVAAGLVQTRLAEAPWTEIGAQFVFQGICVVIVAGLTFITMIQAFGPVRSLMITALVPGLSALGAVIFLGEPLAWSTALGLVLVTAGILIGVRAVPVRRGAPTLAPAAHADGAS